MLSRAFSWLNPCCRLNFGPTSASGRRRPPASRKHRPVAWRLFDFSIHFSRFIVTIVPFFPRISPLSFIQFWTPQTSLQRGPDRPDRLPTSRSPKKPPTVSLKEPVRVKKPLVPRTERRFLASVFLSLYQWGLEVSNHQMGDLSSFYHQMGYQWVI